MPAKEAAGVSAEPAAGAAAEPDAFDRLYLRWAEHALSSNHEPPSRERWDSVVLRLILSEDPARVARYRRIESANPDGLGADAYELWSKMPDYTPNRAVPLRTITEVREYAARQRGATRRLMEAQGLGAKYEQAISTDAQMKVKVRKAQQSVLLIGCIGISAIIFMMLTVFLIIGLQLLGGSG
jgi:hypothetical protein